MEVNIKPNYQSKEAKIVKMIFDSYVIKGMNQSQIVNEINLMGILTRENKKWTVRKTSFILSNVAYYGRLLYELEEENL